MEQIFYNNISKISILTLSLLELLLKIKNKLTEDKVFLYVFYLFVYKKEILIWMIYFCLIIKHVQAILLQLLLNKLTQQYDIMYSKFLD